MIIIVAFTIPIFTETSPKITKNLKINDSNKKFNVLNKMILKGKGHRGLQTFEMFVNETLKI